MANQYENLMSGIKTSHLQNLSDLNGHSAFIAFKDYQILILKLVKLGKGALEENRESFLLRAGVVAQLKKQKVNSIMPGGIDGLYNRLRLSIQHVDELVLQYMDETATLEDSLYDDQKKSGFMSTWFHLKKDLSRIERSLSRASVVLRDFSRSNENSLGDHKQDFIDLTERMEYNVRNCHTTVSKLDSMHHFFNAIRSERVNINVYLMALVSSIFLPLHIIVGFFGMNTGGMFLGSDPNGTQRALVLLSVVFVSLTLGLPLFRIVYNRFFRQIVHRSNLYQNMAEHVTKIEL